MKLLALAFVAHAGRDKSMRRMCVMLMIECSRLDGAAE